MQTNLFIFLLLCLCVCMCLWQSIDATDEETNKPEKIRIVKDERGEYHILYLMFQRSRKLPDEATVRFLGFDPKNAAVMKDSDLASYIDTYSVPLPSLADETHKPAITKHVQRIAALSPNFFWKEMHMLAWMLNPSIAKWQNRLFIAWRNGVYGQPIRFGWLEFSDNEWHVSDTDFYQGIGDHKQVFVKPTGFNQLAEDPRVINRPDGTLMIQYTSKKSLYSAPKQTFLHMLPPGFKGRIRGVGRVENNNLVNSTVSDSVLMDGHFLWIVQKNWVAIPKGDQMYFLESINPLHLMINYDVTQESIGMVATVYNGSKIELPWDPTYGTSIRGGTPALYLPKEDLYLAFFHTVASIISPKVRTYFMGAVAFCPSLPFQIHSVSPYPILKEPLYEGPGVQRDIDHVVFPTSLILDDDKEHIWMTFGSNDKNGYLNKMNIAELLASMEMVYNCQ